MMCITFIKRVFVVCQFLWLLYKADHRRQTFRLLCLLACRTRADTCVDNLCEWVNDLRFTGFICFIGFNFFLELLAYGLKQLLFLCVYKSWHIIKPGCDLFLTPCEPHSVLFELAFDHLLLLFQFVVLFDAAILDGQRQLLDLRRAVFNRLYCIQCLLIMNVKQTLLAHERLTFRPKVCHVLWWMRLARHALLYGSTWPWLSHSLIHFHSLTFA